MKHRLIKWFQRFQRENSGSRICKKLTWLKPTINQKSLSWGSPLKAAWKWSYQTPWFIFLYLSDLIFEWKIFFSPSFLAEIDSKNTSVWWRLKDRSSRIQRYTFLFATKQILQIYTDWNKFRGSWIVRRFLLSRWRRKLWEGLWVFIWSYLPFNYGSQFSVSKIIFNLWRPLWKTSRSLLSFIFALIPFPLILPWS